MVLLPAPLGPSSPTAPPGNVAVTSRSASCRPYFTLTFWSSTVTIRESDTRLRGEGSAKAEGVGLCAHEPDHVADVLLDRQAQLLGSFSQVIARHGAGKRLVFHLLDHGGGFEIEHAL